MKVEGEITVHKFEKITESFYKEPELTAGIVRGSLKGSLFSKSEYPATGIRPLTRGSREGAEATLEDARRPPVRARPASKTARKVQSGPIRPQNSLWRAVSHCDWFSKTGPTLVSNLVMILLPSHRRKQWGQLGEILGGVRFP